MTSRSPLRAFLYGSCVARDTFRTLGARAEITGYVARQSLASAYGPPVDGVGAPDVNLTSSFRRRMLLGDLTSDLRSHLLRDAPRSDLVVWDLTDERLGLYVLADGGVATRSIESIDGGIDPVLTDRGRHVPFGSGEHHALWSSAVPRFLGDLDAVGARDRLVVLGPPWARRMDDGTKTPASFGIEAASANRAYRRYYRTLHRHGVQVIGNRWRGVRAAHDHTWGPAPFHYTDAVYERLTSALAAASGARHASRLSPGRR
ncbi:DUF6270 domain-containing protein [Cellulomonas iranensis]|uniref:DUF6270 domain-containing protein n=1 Tax=Cellulomonas iranensis TaxID=76862 RepID=UPI001CF29A7F|nr:DUF6270 domain-containing protein [Cellulomonas iranensis]UCN14109.1 DUF6270 domain-containing protein [Cellulomonas iranensis]